MGKAGHQRACIQVVHLFFEQTDRHHLLVHVEQSLGAQFRTSPGIRLGLICRSGHFETPDIWTNTLKTTAKSCSTKPMPQAASKNSLVTPVLAPRPPIFHPPPHPTP